MGTTKGKNRIRIFAMAISVLIIGASAWKLTAWWVGPSFVVRQKHCHFGVVSFLCWTKTWFWNKTPQILFRQEAEHLEYKRHHTNNATRCSHLQICFRVLCELDPWADAALRLKKLIKTNRLMNCHFRATDFKEMASKATTNYSALPIFDFTISPFMRKGCVGDWTRHFTVEQNRVLDQHIAEKLDPAGLYFTYEL